MDSFIQVHVMEWINIDEKQNSFISFLSNVSSPSGNNDLVDLCSGKTWNFHIFHLQQTKRSMGILRLLGDHTNELVRMNYSSPNVRKFSILLSMYVSETKKYKRTQENANKKLMLSFVR